PCCRPVRISVTLPCGARAAMSQESYNLWSIILGAAGLTVSFAVGVVVFWYTRVTEGLRRESQQQTALLQDQVAVSQRQADLFAEQVLSAIRPFVACEIETFAPGGS